MEVNTICKQPTRIRVYKAPVMVIGLGVVLLALSCGCARSSAILQEVAPGGFFVDRAGSQVQAQSRIPTTAANVPLGFFAEGLALNTVGEFP